MIKNPNTVAQFLNLKDPDGKPCPISPMNSFWVNRLRVLAMEGMDLKAIVTKVNRQDAAERARLSQQEKRAEAYKKKQAERLEAAKKMAEDQHFEELKQQKLNELKAQDPAEVAD